MTHKKYKTYRFVPVVLALVALLAATQAHAQTTANGPYYATPSWDQTLPASTRFIVLSNFANAAVLDRETGLVWEKVPSTTQLNWASASRHCVRLSLGGRKGWRLPTIQDLASLIDPTQSNPSLPAGHPFTVQSGSLYWSVSSSAKFDTGAWYVYFGNGGVGSADKSDLANYAWCVRGGPGVDPQ